MDLLIAPNTVPQAQADVAPSTGTAAWATDGNPATNTPATIFPAYAFNALQAELTAAIQGAGITLDRTKLNQLAAAIQKMTQGASAITAPDTGAVNAYAITLTPAPAAINAGMIVGISAIIAANTGAATLNTNGLGALPIHGPGGAVLQGGEFVAGGNAILRANATATAWDLVWTNGAMPVANAAHSNQAVNLGQFPANLATSGYTKLPNGLIIQWGLTASIAAAGSGSTTLPIAFPTAIVSCTASYTNVLSPTQATGGNPFNISGISTSAFTIYNGGNLSSQYLWVAIGY